MTQSAQRRALQPLWMMATGAAVAAVTTSTITIPAPSIFGWLLVATGSSAMLWGLLKRRRGWLPWLLVGLAIVGGRGLVAQARQRQAARLTGTDSVAALRIEAVVVEGWADTRWGRSTRVSLRSARHAGRPVELPRRCRLEVRGAGPAARLPKPGATLATLAAVRGEVQRPLLVVSSPRLISEVRPPAGTPRWRDVLATSLLDAAGTNVRRIRAAELAAAIALGRRDLLTRDRREGWRRSGYAHLLAVSGLHVGVVAGSLWLATLALGMPSRAARVLLLVAVPGYAVLAGAAPSALRAALMVVVYVGARLVGRAVVPMAAVLVAALLMLSVSPQLVLSAGFQLTVLITAALVRWVPAAADLLPGPRWLAGTVAVPVVAQLAAAPIVAAHFRVAVPGAVLANLVAPLLLSPLLGAALVATAVAPLWPWLGGILLSATAVVERLLWIGGAIGRKSELLLPTLPAVAVVALVLCGWLALQADRRARLGACGWAATLALCAVLWAARPGPSAPRVDLLPIADGLAAVATTTDGEILVDGGRWQRQAGEMLADLGIRNVSAVIASHTDQDHLGGLATVLRTRRVGRLLAPSWMAREPALVPLLRAARRRGVAIHFVSRGVSVGIGAARLDVLWPPARHLPAEENERSLVARLHFDGRSALLTSDIGHATERMLARRSTLDCDVLVVPHHGSRGSCSTALLDDSQPAVALIPAGPDNRHNHPHSEVLTRLTDRGIPTRYPARDGSCGARFENGRWVAFP